MQQLGSMLISQATIHSSIILLKSIIKPLDLITSNCIWSPHNTKRVIPYSLNKSRSMTRTPTIKLKKLILLKFNKVIINLISLSHYYYRYCYPSFWVIFSWTTFRLRETKRWRRVRGSIWTSSNAAYSPASEVEIPYTCSQSRASWRTSRPSRSSRSPMAVSQVWMLLACCPPPLVRPALIGNWGSSRGISRARTHSPSWLLQLWNINAKTHFHNTKPTVDVTLLAEVQILAKYPFSPSHTCSFVW